MAEKKLKYWADLDLPPLNLWNCPSWLRQRESTKKAVTTVKFRNPSIHNEVYKQCQLHK